MEIVFFIFGCIGMTHIFIDGDIFSSIRDKLQLILPEKLYSMITCYQCLGFWVGIISALMCFGFISIFQLFMGGCASSFLSLFAANLMNYLEAGTILSHEQD